MRADERSEAHSEVVDVHVVVGPVGDTLDAGDGAEGRITDLHAVRSDRAGSGRVGSDRELALEANAAIVSLPRVPDPRDREIAAGSGTGTGCFGSSGELALEANAALGMLLQNAGHGSREAEAGSNGTDTGCFRDSKRLAPEADAAPGSSL